MGGHQGAAYVVSGEYHDRLGRVRLTIELVDVRTRHVLWSEVFDTTLQEAFAVDNSLAPRIVKDVSRAAVLSREVVRATTQPLPTLECHTLMFGAITLVHRASARALDAARGMLDELAYRHRRMGLAYAWLAKWHVLRVVQDWSHDRDAGSIEGLNHARRVLDSNPSNSLVLAMSGLVHGYLRRIVSPPRASTSSKPCTPTRTSPSPSCSTPPGMPNAAKGRRRRSPATRRCACHRWTALPLRLPGGHGAASGASNGVSRSTWPSASGRDDESEADRLGLLRAARAVYEPGKGVLQWRKMVGTGGGASPQILSTQPAGPPRIKDIQPNLPRVLPLFKAAARPERRFAPPPRPAAGSRPAAR